MTLAQLQRIQGTDGFAPQEIRPLKETPTTSFGDTLKNAIQEVDASQKVADAQVESFVAGEQENVHEVMIAMNQARLQFQLMTEVRSRLLETYQELMRLQV